MKFKGKNWVEINDHTPGKYNANSKFKFKPTMLNSSPCDYSAGYIFGKGNITIAGAWAEATATQACKRNKQANFKNCVPFMDFISEINNISR